MCKGLIILMTVILPIQGIFVQMDGFQNSNEFKIMPYSQRKEFNNPEKIPVQGYDKGSSDTICAKKIVTEIKTAYRTECLNWKYVDNSWWFKDRKVDVFPPSYEKQTISESQIWEFNKETNIHSSNIEREELIEYFEIENGWHWNENKKKWEAESKAIKGHPNYKIVKTVSFK